MSLFFFLGGGGGGAVQLCVQGSSVGVGDKKRKIAVYKYNWGIKLAIHDISQNSVKVSYVTFFMIIIP